MVESLWKQFLTELNVVIQPDLSITLLDCSANDLIMPTQKHAHEFYNSLIHSLTHKLEAMNYQITERNG